jgi:hypothetical protein
MSTDGQDRRGWAKDLVKKKLFLDPPARARWLKIFTLNPKAIPLCAGWLGLGVKGLNFISTNSDTATKCNKKKLTQLIRAPSTFPHRHPQKIVAAYSSLVLLIASCTKCNNISGVNNYVMIFNPTNVYSIFCSATCFNLTVDYHQALQIVYNIKGIHKNCFIWIEIWLLQRVYQVSVQVWFT